jgi:hypothetical protein
MSVRAFLIVTILLRSLAPLAAQTPINAALIQSAGFIFRGTVQKAAASNVKALPASSNTIVVRVDEILKSPTALESVLGKDVTVQLLGSSTLKEQQQAIFFTSGFLYGENIGVKEVRTVTSRVDSQTMAGQIAQAGVQGSEQALSARIANSTLVITGKVVEVAALISKEAALRRSEHDPELWRAEIEIATVEKGQRPASGRVTVYFAKSDDERWILSPKYTTGQEGIFLLHSDAAKLIGQSGFSTLNRLDFQPANQIETVRRLIKTPR